MLNKNSNQNFRWDFLSLAEKQAKDKKSREVNVMLTKPSQATHSL